MRHRSHMLRLLLPILGLQVRCTVGYLLVQEEDQSFFRFGDISDTVQKLMHPVIDALLYIKTEQMAYLFKLDHSYIVLLMCGTIYEMYKPDGRRQKLQRFFLPLLYAII